mmetsp:Transcript_11017/g.19950  ORF Transcript_11017/g.19950 Transcript_11017/m.19950 type:complete len:146 (-) Transcript_11017:513-950(-)
MLAMSITTRNSYRTCNSLNVCHGHSPDKSDILETECSDMLRWSVSGSNLQCASTIRPPSHSSGRHVPKLESSYRKSAWFVPQVLSTICTLRYIALSPLLCPSKIGHHFKKIAGDFLALYENTDLLKRKHTINASSPATAAPPMNV